MTFNIYSHIISMDNDIIPLVKFTVGNLMKGLKTSEAISIALLHQPNKEIDPLIGGIYFHRGAASKLIFLSTPEYASKFITSFETHDMSQLFYYPYNGNNISVSSPEVCEKGKIIYEANANNWYDTTNIIWASSSILSFERALRVLIENHDNDLRYLLLDRGKTSDYVVFLVGFQTREAGNSFINERRKYNEMVVGLNKNLCFEGQNLFCVTPQPLSEEMEVDNREIRMKKSLSYREYREAKYTKTKNYPVESKNTEEICMCHECKIRRSKERCNNHLEKLKRRPDDHHGPGRGHFKQRRGYHHKY